MKIQICSDLHVEINDSFDIKQTAADVLVLAGDICTVPRIKTLEKFLRHHSYRWILHVPGNHEYYSRKYSMNEIDEKFKKIEERFPNYRYLLNESVTIDDVTFIGSILWTFVPRKYYAQIHSYMNDYVNIRLGDHQLLQVTDTQRMHNECLQFIQSAKTNSPTEKIVLIVHHKPCWDLDERYPLFSQHAFQSDCDYLTEGVDLCIFGHTHSSYDKTIGECQVISNPKGYQDENILYENDYVVEI